MPKTHRQLIYRKLAQAYINITYAGKFIDELETQYRPHHVELADALSNALYGLALVMDILEKFGKEISGANEINWNAWASTGRPRYTITDNEEDEQEDYIADEPIPDETHPNDK